MPAERRADDFTPLGAGEVQGAAYGYRTPRVIPAFREHLFYGLLLDMKAMYQRGAASAPLADTRSFCRYMADRIDRELAVEWTLDKQAGMQPRGCQLPVCCPGRSACLVENYGLSG